MQDVDEAPDDVEPEAHPGQAARLGLGPPGVEPEDLGPVLGGDPHARVLDRHLDDPVPRGPADVDDDGALGGVLERVGHQVDQDLLQLEPVGHEGWDALVGREEEADWGLLVGRDRQANLVEKLPDVELLDVDRHRARFEPRSIERAIDEREELEGVGVDLADRVLVRRRDRSEDAIPEHVSIAEDDAERAPHLVRHGAEEGRLQGNDLLCRSRATLRFAGARGEVPIAERGHEEERDPQQCGRGPRDPRREDGEVGDGGERGTERRQLEPTAERGEEDHEEEHEEEVRPRASADPEGRGDQRRVRRDQDGVEGRVVKGRLREPHQDEVRGEEEGDAEARTPAGRVARAEEHEIRQRDRHHPAEDHDDPPLVPCQHRQPHTPART